MQAQIQLRASTNNSSKSNHAGYETTHPPKIQKPVSYVNTRLTQPNQIKSIQHLSNPIMESPRLISQTLTPFLFFLLLLFTTMAAASDFIRASCNDTSYPSLCYTTLSPHAPSINNSNALLAQTAISISLKKSKAAAAYVTRLSTSTPESKDLAPVLDDCVSTLKNAAELARDSMKQMKEIIVGNAGASVDKSVRFKVSNVQTWLSAALSSQVTCIDGFEGVADGLLKGEVVKRAGVAKKVTSNALALINKYVNA